MSLRATTPPADGSRPRVVYVTASLPFGNSEHFVVPEIDELERQGIEIIVCPRKWQASTVAADRLHLVDRTLEARLISPRIVAGTARAFLRSPSGVARAVWRLRVSRSLGVLAKNLAVVPKGLWLSEYVRAHGVRHLHAHWASTTATLTMLASEVSGVPFSFTAHRWDIAEDNLLATKVRAAAFVRAIDRLGAEELASRADADASEIVVIHMGVAAVRQRAMRDLATPPCVVIPAGLIEIKGHTYLLQAVALLAERGTPVRLEIVGDGPGRAPIEREIDSRGLRDLVVVRGFITHDQLLQELEDGRYDIAVLPSAGTAADAREGIPVALMEALAAGVPAVGTDMGGIPELLHDGAGVLVPERSPGAIADAIERLVADPAYREDVVECGNARIRQEFAIELICLELATRFLAS